ncbi:hypothetical protein LA76x_4651 [Lysobacter antibioticus]|uniref:Uncharacterized protein n=1 Tax=Lysobacter antibioticus TaxID=84531 RepID=A0A0S2FGZ5_LYSAN|nr:hypothetical protein LA76x_4651 [Lysobacter antibioticus]
MARVVVGAPSDRDNRNSVGFRVPVHVQVLHRLQKGELQKIEARRRPLSGRRNRGRTPAPETRFRTPEMPSKILFKKENRQHAGFPDRNRHAKPADHPSRHPCRTAPRHPRPTVGLRLRVAVVQRRGACPVASR